VSDLINAGERRRGEFIHKVLAHIEFADDTAEDAVRQIIEKLKQETAEEYQESEIAAAVLSMLGHSEVSRYFRPVPGRTVMVEVNVSDPEGRLFRIDRLVIDRQSITVIDFKTGGDRGAEEQYLDQVRNYLKIAGSLFAPRTVTGLLVYIDLGKVKAVS
jgi:ATP-dependent exoDNAse (exonuclease V) beta subunit